MRKMSRETWNSIKSAKLVAENIEEGSDVLEIAPGPGYLSIELAKLGNYNVSEDLKSVIPLLKLKRLRQELGLKINFTHEEMPTYIHFEDESFLILLYVQRRLKILPNPVMALNEIYRVLKPNGKGLIIKS